MFSDILPPALFLHELFSIESQEWSLKIELSEQNFTQVFCLFLGDLKHWRSRCFLVFVWQGGVLIPTLVINAISSLDAKTTGLEWSVGKRINPFLPVCPGQVPVWTAVHNWAVLSTTPQTAEEGTEGWSALVCTQLGGSVFLQGSALPQPLTCQDLGRTPLTGQCPQAHPATPRAPQPHTLNSLCHHRVYVGPHQPQVLINLCLQRARGDQINEATTRESHPAIPNLCADTPTWYLSYTTGRVNIDTTAEEEKSTELCSCRSDSSRGETYFGDKHIIVPLGQLIHQGALY